ncbi:hypothetical protein KW790_02685 [Candidatus Parcubacteria bacterium]|nr:hypothetical protein [Candidatus Parcubacteria bacterium]
MPDSEEGEDRPQDLLPIPWPKNEGELYSIQYMYTFNKEQREMERERRRRSRSIDLQAEIRDMNTQNPHEPE